MDYKPNKIVSHTDRQYYILIEREGSPINALKYPIEIGLSSLTEIPALFYGYTAEELSDYLIKNDKKLSKGRKQTFEDALVIISKLGKNAKMYITYEEKK